MPRVGLSTTTVLSALLLFTHASVCWGFNTPRLSVRLPTRCQRMLLASADRHELTPEAVKLAQKETSYDVSLFTLPTLLTMGRVAAIPLFTQLFMTEKVRACCTEKHCFVSLMPHYTVFGSRGSVRVERTHRLVRRLSCA
jgi:hypothetical protein